MSFAYVLVMMLLLGFAFDYRQIDENALSFMQPLFLATALLGGLSLLASRIIESRGRIGVARKGGFFILWAGVLFASWAPIPIIAGTSVVSPDFFSVFLPYALYAVTMLSIVCAINGGLKPISIVKILIILATISSIWRVIYAVTISGVDISQARWQILSPTLPILLGAGIAGLSVARQRALPILGIMLFLLIVAISVTRAYLFSIVAIIACTFLLGKKVRKKDNLFRRLFKPLILILGVLIIFVVVVDFVLPDLSTRWTDRLTNEKSASGADVTFITRVAENKGLVDSVIESPSAMLVGNGFGSAYMWDKTTLDILSFDPGALNNTRGSHSTWVYPIYADGVVVGLLFLVSLMWTFVIGLRRCRRPFPDERERFASLFALYSLVASFGVSLTSNLINERLGGIVIGALVALIIAAREPSVQRESLSVAYEGMAKP